MKGLRPGQCFGCSDRTYKGLKHKARHPRRAARKRTWSSDRTYKGLKPFIARPVLSLLGYIRSDRTYKGLKRKGSARCTGLLQLVPTVPIRV